MELGKKTRMTRQRRVILEEVRKINDHPAADEIYERVRKRLHRISLGTVYRNLDLLCEVGEIQRLELSGAMKRYDGNAKNITTSAASAVTASMVHRSPTGR